MPCSPGDMPDWTAIEVQHDSAVKSRLGVRDRAQQCAHRGVVIGEPRVLRRAGTGDVEVRVVDGARQGTAADGLVRGQRDSVDQAELEPVRRWGVRCRVRI